MTDTWYKYQVFCLDEVEDPDHPGTFLGGWVTRFTDDPEQKPVVCPNNSTHRVVPDSLQDLDSRDLTSTFINVERSAKTGGYYRCDCFTMDVPPHSTASRTMEFGFPVTVLCPTLHTTDSQLGDIFEVSFPYQTVGYITQAAEQGATVLHVSGTVLENAAVGFDIRLTDGASLLDVVGRVSAINKVNSTITVLGATAQALPSYTMVQATRAFIDKVELGMGNNYKFAGGNFVGSYLPQGTTGNMIYTNVHDTPARVVLHVDYMY